MAIAVGDSTVDTFVAATENVDVLLLRSVERDDVYVSTFVNQQLWRTVVHYERIIRSFAICSPLENTVARTEHSGQDRTQ